MRGGRRRSSCSEVSRGAAFGDVDNDGDVDVLVANNNGTARLLINDDRRRNHWVGLRLVGGAARPGRGHAGRARRASSADDGSTLWRRARADGSYASANNPQSARRARSVVEAAPGARHLARAARSEEWASVPVDRYTTLTEGSGK